MSETEELKELRITKRIGGESGEYGDVYKVKFPITFYFNKDGTYDGFEFYTKDITEDEAGLLEELVNKLEEEEEDEEENVE